MPDREAVADRRPHDQFVLDSGQQIAQRESPVGVRNRQAARDTIGRRKHLGHRTGHARFAGVLDPILVLVPPRAVADRGGVGQFHDRNRQRPLEPQPGKVGHPYSDAVRAADVEVEYRAGQQQIALDAKRSVVRISRPGHQAERKPLVRIGIGAQQPPDDRPRRLLFQDRCDRQCQVGGTLHQVQPDQKRIGPAEAGEWKCAFARIEVGRAAERTRGVDAAVGGCRQGVHVVVLCAAHRRGPNQTPGGIQPHHDRILAAGAGQVQRCRPRIEVAGFLEIATHVHVAVRGQRESVVHVVVRSAQLSGPEIIPRLVQPEHEHVVPAGAGQVRRARAGVEVGCPGKHAGNVDTAVVRHGDAPARVGAGPAELLGPDQVALGVQPDHKRVVATGRHQGASTRARIEIDSAGKRARDVQAAVVAFGQTVRNVVADAPPTPRPNEVAPRVPPSDVGIRIAGAGQQNLGRTGIEIGGRAEVAGQQQAAIRTRHGQLCDSWHQRLDPHEPTCRIQLQYERRGRRRGQRELAEPRIEIDRPGKGSGDIQAAVGPQRDVAAVIAAGSADALRPDEHPAAGVFGHEHVRRSHGRQVVAARPWIEIHRTGERPGHVDVARIVHRHRAPFVVRDPAGPHGKPEGRGGPDQPRIDTRQILTGRQHERMTRSQRVGVAVHIVVARVGRCKAVSDRHAEDDVIIHSRQQAADRITTGLVRDRRAAPHAVGGRKHLGHGSRYDRLAVVPHAVLVQVLPDQAAHAGGIRQRRYADRQRRFNSEAREVRRSDSYRVRRLDQIVEFGVGHQPSTAQRERTVVVVPQSHDQFERELLARIRIDPDQRPDDRPGRLMLENTVGGQHHSRRVAGRRQFRHVDVLVAEAGQGIDSAARIEIGRALQPSDDYHTASGAILAEREIIRGVSVQSLNPQEVSGGIQPGNKRVIATGRGQAKRARPGIEIDDRVEVA